MKGLLEKMIVPVAVTVLTAAHSVGTPHPAPRPSYRFPPDTVRTGTALQDTVLRDTTVAARFDEEDFYDLFADTLEAEVPRISARDTMKVPDSLRYTDPFLHRWYVAVKDSLTHRIVVDSLRAAGDSVAWRAIDSLYLRDSSARARYDVWFNSLSKQEKRRVLYERELPAKLHRMDSLQHAKDSLRERRDSIRAATPRILETFAIPDSMHYRRILLWRHDRYFNQVALEPLDTGYNYHFNDYPLYREDVGATWLGVAGSAYQTYDFFKRGSREGISFYDAVEGWSYSPETLPMYNTKTPYTELQYTGTLFANDEKASNNLHILTTQNIYPQLNVTFEYDRYGGKGILQHEESASKTLAVHANWMGRKHLLHAGYIYNRVLRDENGGVTDRSMIRDTTVDAREIAVHLTDAANEYKKRTLFLDQTYRIPFNFIEDLRHRGDTAWQKAPARDSVNRDITTAYVGHASEYSVYTKVYEDGISATATGTAAEAARAFYHDNFFISPKASRDSLRVMKLDNRIFLRLQPWSEDALVSKVEGGVGDRLLDHYLFSPAQYIGGASHNTVWNTAYVYAGAEGRLRQYIAWDALGSYSFAGTGANDFFVRANARFSFFPFRRDRRSPVSLTARFETSLQEPGFYEQHFYSNHYRWDNDFTKVSTTKLQGTLDIPRWDLRLDAAYALVAGHVWYDTLGLPAQCADPVSVFKAGLSKDFALGGLHLDNRALFQLSSNPAVLPLPALALNLRWYYQFDVKRDVMQMQLGVNALYTTRWYTPAYNPVAGVFHAQDETQYGHSPYVDVFLNIQWKRACIFLKLENINNGWPKTHRDYFSAHDYIHPQREFRNVKFGIWWPFYVQSGRQRTLSERAGSGMGGGASGGMSSTLGGLRSSFGN